jgi:hypothetical protein
VTAIVAQIAPQRSTQYAELVTALAPHEIALSAVGSHLKDDISLIQLGQQNYLKLELDTELDESLKQTLDNFATTNAYFTYYDRLGDVTGPLLKPIEIPHDPPFPTSLIATRRYRGKTNELFTQFMCNVARYSSDYAKTPWRKITLFDPLCGGGTTLFVGLVLGADVVGIEKNQQSVEKTISFLKEYMKEARISAKFRVDRFKNVGKRWFITLDKSIRCVVGRGNTSDAKYFVNGLKRPQLIVTDLPYGIQHRAEWQELLVSALPVWSQNMADGGALVFSWDATRFPRDEMIQLVQEVSDFTVLNQPPYNQLAHRVDRVIKHRDVIVARRES